MMLETFPAAATEQMINEANEGGWNALFVIVVVFVLVIAGIIFYNNRRTARSPLDVRSGGRAARGGQADRSGWCSWIWMPIGSAT